MKTTLSLLFVVNAFSLLAQQSSLLPQALDKSVNTKYHEINPVLAPDGKTLFFTRVNHPENKYGKHNSEDIWQAELQPDGTWSEATRVTDLNIGRYNSVMGITSDGKTILINGIYNRRATIWSKRGLSISTKVGDKWSRPKELKVKKLSRKNKGRRSTATISADGKLLVLSYSKRWNGKRTSLYVSERKNKGNFKKPKKLKTLNTKRNEEAPFLSVDNKTLYFSSDRVSKGRFDLYKATHTKGSWKSWSKPVLLSDTVNSPAWDSYFKTNAKGSYGYFSSNRESLNGADIYKIKLFEENPFVIVSGEIRNSKSRRLLVKKDITILINGKTDTSAVVSRDSATYKVKLPLGKKYSIGTSVDYFTSITDSIDVSQIREFTEMRKHLKAQPFPYVTVKGKLLIQNSSDIIPYSAKPVVLVDGRTTDAVIVNADGTYTLQIKYGAVYSIQVNAKRFESTPQTLNLANIDEFREMTVDLFADPEKGVTVVGNIIDKKTGTRMANLQEVHIAVEGMDTVRARVNQNGRYELRLPLGKSYTISATAPNYYPVYETVDAVQSTGDVTFNKDLVIVPIEVGQSIRLNNIFFDPAKSVLKQESFEELDRVADFLQNSPAIKIEIAGYTDNVGKAATNLKLSQARAKAVADYVIKKGIDSSRIKAKGYGSEKPVESNSTKQGQAKNRRVEFTILDMED